MTWLDIVIVLAMLVSTLYSIYRGLIKEVFSFISLSAGYILANNLYLPIKQIADNNLSFAVPVWAVYIIVFLLTCFLIAITGTLVKKTIHISITLKIVDSIGGGVIGALKALLILSLLTFLLSSFKSSNSLLKKSILPPYLVKSFKIMTVFSSSDLIFNQEKKINDLKSKLNSRLNSIKEVAKNKLNEEALKKIKNGENISDDDRLKLEKLIKKSMGK